MRHRSALLVPLFFIASGCEKTPDPAASGPAVLSEPNYFSTASAGESANYFGPASADAKFAIKIFEFENEPGALGMKYTGSVDGKSQQGGRERLPRGDWLKRIFRYAGIDSRSPAEISVADQMIDGEILTVSENGDANLVFEMSPTVPAGGLVRIYRTTAKDSGRREMLLELAGHSAVERLPTIAGPGLNPSPEESDENGKVVYLDNFDALLAKYYVTGFLTGWMSAGQPALDAALVDREFSGDILGEVMLKIGGALFAKDATAFDERMKFSPFTGAQAKVESFAVLKALGGPVAQVVIDFQLADGTTSRVTYDLRKVAWQGEANFDLLNVHYPGEVESLRDWMSQWSQ